MLSDALLIRLASTVLPRRAAGQSSWLLLLERSCLVILSLCMCLLPELALWVWWWTKRNTSVMLHGNVNLTSWTKLLICISWSQNLYSSLNGSWLYAKLNVLSSTEVMAESTEPSLSETPCLTCQRFAMVQLHWRFPTTGSLSLGSRGKSEAHSISQFSEIISARWAVSHFWSWPNIVLQMYCDVGL